MSVQIERREFLQMMEAATEGITASTRAKLRSVAESTDAVAIGWWHCDGVSCLARQAARHNQRFQEAFDRAMAARFNRPVSEPFVLEITGPATQR